MPFIKKRCVIFSAAPIDDIQMMPTIDPVQDYIICADAGYVHAKKMNIIPNIVVGDFDSYEQPIDDTIEVLRYATQKDDTDTMIAIKLALEKGFSNICLIGAIGGQYGHTFANIQAMHYIANRASAVVCYAGDTVFRMVKNNTICLHKKEGAYLSVFSYCDMSYGVSIQGTKYTLEDAVLSNDFPLGVSNEIIEDMAIISVKMGSLLIITNR